VCKTYIFRWGNNPKRKTLKGRECIILAVGKKASVLVKFTDNNQKEIVSRRALHGVK